MDDNFTLTNDPPKPVFWRPEKAEPKRQGTLFAGLGCQAGQMDLFETDGQIPSQSETVGHDLSRQK